MAIYKTKTMTSMTILQGVTELDTSPLRQIPEQCQRTLSNATIERLRAARDARQAVIAGGFSKAAEQESRKVYFAAVVAAAAELGLSIGKGHGTRDWNNAIAAIDKACPDWRGYIVKTINPYAVEFAA